MKKNHPVRSIGRYCLLLFVMAIVLTSCSSGLQVRSDIDPTMDFSQYKTYNFFEPLGIEGGYNSPIFGEHYRAAISGELARRKYQTADKPDLLINVTIPPFKGRAIFAKLAQREGLDFAAGTFAAAVTGPNDKLESVRLVMNSIGPLPQALTESERLLKESGLTDEGIEAAAMAARGAMGEITNIFTPSGFKRRLVKTLIRDALIDLREQAVQKPGPDDE